MVVQSRFMCPVTLDQNSGGTGVLTPGLPHDHHNGPTRRSSGPKIQIQGKLRRYLTNTCSGTSHLAVVSSALRHHDRARCLSRGQTQSPFPFANQPSASDGDLLQLPATTVLFSSCRLRCAIMSIALCKWAGRQYPSRTPGRTLQLCHYVVCLMILSKRYSPRHTRWLAWRNKLSIEKENTSQNREECQLGNRPNILGEWP